MKKKSIWVHTLVKNEERYLWYAVMSVVDYVDKILLWDTGSSDHTREIIKEIKKLKGYKIDFQEVGEVDIEEFTRVRQRMLEQTKSDWFLVVDGDEVWAEESIKRLVDEIAAEGDKLETIISPYYNIIGDIYHYQEAAAGRYVIDDKKGHFNIRAMNRKIPGLHLEKPHGQQGFYDERGTLIQDRDKKYRKFLDAPYLHFTNMRRSFSSATDSSVPKRKIKYKYELGIPFPTDFRYPEVFDQPHPGFVLSPWEKMSKGYLLRAGVETILKKFKRRSGLFKTVGY